MLYENCCGHRKSVKGMKVPHIVVFLADNDIFKVVPGYENLLNACFRVSFEGYRHDTLFSQAFHNPEILQRQKSYAVTLESCALRLTESDPIFSGQSVVIINKVLNKAKITWVLVLLLIISPGLGVAVGLWSRKAEVGIAVSAGVFALASSLQGFAGWLDS